MDQEDSEDSDKWEQLAFYIFAAAIFPFFYDSMYMYVSHFILACH